MVIHESSRNKTNLGATEATYAVIGRVLEFHGNWLANLDGALRTWVGSLPVVQDPRASPIVYNFLSQLMNVNHQSVLMNPIALIDNTVKARVASPSDYETEPRLAPSGLKLLLKNDLCSFCLNYSTNYFLP